MPNRNQLGGDLCAIFVHAGAGFHSVANEKLHLRAVNDAAQIGMAILKSGGDAVDAVEMAIRLLEDREITNAGYGSNLTLDGAVECDATMVDHLGRSGAVGAISRKWYILPDHISFVKNPIAAARLVLEASSRPLSLARVPPNLLVGPGATEFAAEHGIIIMPHDYLIAEAARTRWQAWSEDLRREAAKNIDGHNATQPQQPRPQPEPSTDFKLNPHAKVFSPPFSPIVTNRTTTALSGVAPPAQPLQASTADLTHLGPSHEPDPATVAQHAVAPETYHDYDKVLDDWTKGDHAPDVGTDDRFEVVKRPAKRPWADGSTGSANADAVGNAVMTGQSTTTRAAEKTGIKGDHVTDTVGVIAIDCFGNVAAGSSSGGIGMKHKGRCGPAALVGIGTAVIPVHDDDPDETCVATVTSGTGEHMATTAAAATAADRIYMGVRKEGTKLVACDEQEALLSMIENDFMKHAGVRNQPCAGAIGILAVKKSKDGVYFYFGHNTDSFAIASMHSDERKPVCVMSRNKGNGSVVAGGRKCVARRGK